MPPGFVLALFIGFFPRERIRRRCSKVTQFLPKFWNLSFMDQAYKLDNGKWAFEPKTGLEIFYREPQLEEHP